MTFASWVASYESSQGVQKAHLGWAWFFLKVCFGLFITVYSFSFAPAGSVLGPILLSLLGVVLFHKTLSSPTQGSLNPRRVLFLLECEFPRAPLSPLSLDPESSVEDYEGFLKNILQEALLRYQGLYKKVLFGAGGFCLGAVLCLGLGGWQRLREQADWLLTWGSLGVLEVQGIPGEKPKGFELVASRLPLRLKLQTPNLLSLHLHSSFSPAELPRGELILRSKTAPPTALALSSAFSVLEAGELVLLTPAGRQIPLAELDLEALTPPQVHLESRVPTGPEVKWPAAKPLPLRFEATSTAPLERVELVVEAESQSQRQALKNVGRLQSLRRIEKGFLVNFQEIATKPETKVRFWIQALDRTRPLPLMGKSEVLELIVVAQGGSKGEDSLDPDSTKNGAKQDSDQGQDHSAYLEEMDMDQAYEVGRFFREDVLEDFETLDPGPLPPQVIDNYLKKVVR